MNQPVSLAFTLNGKDESQLYDKEWLEVALLHKFEDPNTRTPLKKGDYKISEERTAKAVIEKRLSFLEKQTKDKELQKQKSLAQGTTIPLLNKPVSPLSPMAKQALQNEVNKRSKAANANPSATSTVPPPASKGASPKPPSRQPPLPPTTKSQKKG